MIVCEGVLQLNLVMTTEADGLHADPKQWTKIAPRKEGSWWPD